MGYVGGGEEGLGLNVDWGGDTRDHQTKSRIRRGRSPKGTETTSRPESELGN